MKIYRFFGWAGLVAALLAHSTAQAQTNPRLDPAFQRAEIYRPAFISQVCQLASGARLVLDANYSLTRADGQPANGLVRYTPAGVLDAAFTAQVAGYGSWGPSRVVEQPDGKLLVAVFRLQTGGLTREGLVRLNADGTLDPTLNVSGGIQGQVWEILVQPDGKIVLAGRLMQAGGQTVGNLTRLNADGSLDTAFQTAGTGANGFVSSVARQPDGKLLVAGQFTTLNGQPSPAIGRLNADGSFDSSFAVQARPAASAVGMALQPDGNILVLSGPAAGIVTGAGANRRLVRLLPSGALDAAFTGGQSAGLGLTTSTYHPVQVQADGRILVASTGRAPSGPVPQLLRLNANGTPDASFQFGALATTSTQYQLSYQPLPSGQVLVGGEPLRYSGGPRYGLNAVLLTATGSLDTGFRPRLERPGAVYALAQQPDGKLLAGGDFSSLNGQLAVNMARLLPSGALDTAYTRLAQATAPVRALALQAGGKLLAGGEFDAIGGGNRAGLARLLPTGQLDTGFEAGLTLVSNSGTTPGVYQLAPQPNGNLFVGGEFVRSSNGQTQEDLVNMLPDGQPELGFQPNASLTTVARRCLLVQPDGRLLLGTGDFTPPTATGPAAPRLLRLLPTGQPDPSFTPLPGAAPDNYAAVRALAMDAAGNILADDYAYASGLSTTAYSYIQRLLPDGTADQTFSVGNNLGLTSNSEVTSILPQPNGRILLTGFLNVGGTAYYGLVRLLPDGHVDADFTLNQSPDYTAYDALIQPDGKLVVGGDFTTVGSQAVIALARLLDANVLTVGKSQSEPSVAAWPIPAHDALHLRLEASGQPQHLQLYDTMGRLVISQPVTQPTLTLPLTALAPGMYILRVNYRSGVVSRRIIIQ